MQTLTPTGLADSPDVSVVVTCFNYGCFLADSLGSILSQSGVTVEAIVVDDASTDDSLTTARTLADRDRRITVVAAGTNRGPVGAFNLGLESVRGQYVVRLDADDAVTPGAFERAVSLLQAVPRVGMVYGKPMHFEGELPELEPQVTQQWYVYTSTEWLERRCLTATNAITSPEVVLRREVVERIGGMNPALPHGHDLDMWLRAAAVSDVGWLKGPVQALHREHGASRFQNLVGTRFRDVEERWKVFSAFYASRVSDPYQYLHDETAKALASEAIEIVARDYDRGRSASVDEARALELAATIWPRADELPVSRWLRVRRAMGRQLTPWTPLAWTAMFRRRLRDDVGRSRWKRTGV
jgi:glycosyltransferase involved in cell wall biosynthesis